MCTIAWTIQVQPSLEWKTRPRFCPVSLSLSMLPPFSQITDEPEKLETDKHSSLFCFTVGDEEKKFYKIGTSLSNKMWRDPRTFWPTGCRLIWSTGCRWVCSTGGRWGWSTGGRWLCSTGCRWLWSTGCRWIWSTGCRWICSTGCRWIWSTNVGTVVGVWWICSKKLEVVGEFSSTKGDVGEIWGRF